MQPEDLQQIRGIVREEVKDELKVYTEETLLPTFGKYTEEVILPAIQASEERMIQHMDHTIGKLRSDLIDYVSRQIGDAKAEIIKEIRAARERDRIFRTTVLGILERNQLARPDEINLLRDIIRQEG